MSVWSNQSWGCQGAMSLSLRPSCSCEEGTQQTVSSCWQLQVPHWPKSFCAKTYFPRAACIRPSAGHSDGQYSLQSPPSACQDFIGTASLFSFTLYPVLPFSSLLRLWCLFFSLLTPTQCLFLLKTTAANLGPLSHLTKTSRINNPCNFQ